jgi:hypothetical protein
VTISLVIFIKIQYGKFFTCCYHISMIHEMSYLPKHFEMDQDLLEQMSGRTGCQRCVSGQSGEMLIVVHDVPAPGIPERRALFFWHQKDGNWIGAESGGLRGLYELLETYARAIDVHEAVVDDADTAKEIFTILRHAGPLSRSARNLHLALQEAAVKFPKDKELRMLRDRAHENERAAELLYADARVALEFYRAERAEEQAQSSDRLAKIGFRLNLLAGFFLPLVALGGLMGMNVNLPPFVQNSFWGIFFGGLSIGLILVTLVGYRTGYKASREDQNKE